MGMMLDSKTILQSRYRVRAPPDLKVNGASGALLAQPQIPRAVANQTNSQPGLVASAAMCSASAAPSARPTPGILVARPETSAVAT